MFGEIMTERFPELMNLPGNASKSDLISVLQSYGVTSADQQRKILAFYVAAADYAGLPTSPHLRPTKARTGLAQAKDDLAERGRGWDRGAQDSAGATLFTSAAYD